MKSTWAAKNVAEATRSSPTAGHVGQRRRQQRAADAVADGVDLALAGRLLDDIQRLDHAVAGIILERLLRQMLVRIDPGDDEHRQPLVDAPLDERLIRGEVEDIELVDPRRHDQQRLLEHHLGRRGVLDELKQFVLEDHLAGREREVAADLERLGVRLPDLELAVPGLDVLGQHVHAAHQVVGVAAQGFAQQLGIGQHEIRGRDRVGDLSQIELGLVMGVRVEPLGVLHQMIGPMHGEQVGLLEEVVELVAGPFRIGEPLVARIGRGDRRHLFPGHALDRARPQVEVGLAEA